MLLHLSLIILQLIFVKIRPELILVETILHFNRLQKFDH